MQVIRTPTADISYDERGFVKIVLLDNDKDITLQEAENHIQAIHQLVGEKKMPAFVDARQGRHNLEKEAMHVLATYPYKTAEAILIESLGQRILGNFFIRFTKSKRSKFPSKLFTNEEEALQWILSFT